MQSKRISPTFKIAQSAWLYYLIIFFIIEKVIQHIVVTAAFAFNWTDIASEVVVSPKVLMVAGAFIDVLFIAALGGMVKKQTWAIYLTIALALFDFIGEFVAQGRVDIVITVSIIAATFLLILTLSLYRQLLLKPESS